MTMGKTKPTIVLGADHAGYALKEQLKKTLSKTYRVVDEGNLSLNIHDDYPDYASAVARRIIKHHEFGILICGSAQGICIAANKIRGARAVAVTTKRDAKCTREHNDANILCLSGWNMSTSRAKELISTFVSTPFSGEERHIRRIKKIAQLEQ